MDTNHRPPRDALGRFWRAALAQSGDRHLGLSAAEAWEPRADHLVVLLLTSAETVGEGLEASLRYQELLSHGRVVTLGEHPEYHVLHINKIEHELPITAHEIEFIAVFVMKLLRFATDGAFKAQEVHFEHPYRGDIQKYTRAFGCSVLFGKEKTAILADDEAWALPLAHGNQALHGQLRGVACGASRDDRVPSFHRHGSRSHQASASEREVEHRGGGVVASHDPAHPATPPSRRRYDVPRVDGRRP